MADDRRRILHEELSKVPNIAKVYFQPPEKSRIEYPCILYSLSRIETDKANNKSYLKHKGYNVTVITSNPDDTSVDYILEHFPNARFDRQFKSDNLYHNVMTLFY